MHLFPVLTLALLIAVPLGSQESSPNVATNGGQQTAASPGSPANADEGVQNLDIKAGMHPPKAIFQPEAEYSNAAREKLLNGKCSISMIVDPKGMPQKVHIVRCTDPVFAPMSLASTSRYRFQPATTAEGKPVAVRISVEVNFQIEGGREVRDPIRLGFGSPPGTVSLTPDSSGIYTYSSAITPPVITKFAGEGYTETAFAREGKSPCELILTLDGKGKPISAIPTSCEPEVLAQEAAKTLLASRYKPAKLQGSAVPVRTLVHLEYGEFAATP